MYAEKIQLTQLLHLKAFVVSLGVDIKRRSLQCLWTTQLNTGFGLKGKKYTLESHKNATSKSVTKSFFLKKKIQLKTIISAQTLYFIFPAYDWFHSVIHYHAFRIGMFKLPLF